MKSPKTKALEILVKYNFSKEDAGVLFDSLVKMESSSSYSIDVILRMDSSLSDSSKNLKEISNDIQLLGAKIELYKIQFIIWLILLCLGFSGIIIIVLKFL